VCCNSSACASLLCAPTQISVVYFYYLLLSSIVHSFIYFYLVLFIHLFTFILYCSFIYLLLSCIVHSFIYFHLVLFIHWGFFQPHFRLLGTPTLLAQSTRRCMRSCVPCALASHTRQAPEDLPPTLTMATRSGTWRRGCGQPGLLSTPTSHETCSSTCKRGLVALAKCVQDLMLRQILHELLAALKATVF
jgi:hypothetical protein